METSVDSVLDRSGPEWSYYQSSLDRFGGDEIITVLVDGGRPFDLDTLATILTLSDALARVEGVRRVDSLATVPLIREGTRGGVLLESGLAEGVPQTPQDLIRLSELLQTDRIANGALMSPDGRFFAVNLVLHRESKAHYEEILSAVDRELVGRSAFVSGVPIFRMEADTRTRTELGTFVPITVAAIGCLLFLVFGSVLAVIVPLTASGLGTWVMLGVMGGMGIPMTITTVVLPSILLALGCAYSAHILMAAGSTGPDRDLSLALDDVALPIALSGLTTAVGFVAVSLVKIDTIRYMGGFGALGVLTVLAATLTAAPALLRLRPKEWRRARLQGWLSERGAPWLVYTVRRFRWRILVAWSLGLVFVGLGVALLEVETDVIVWFPEHDPVRVAHSTIRQELSGISPMNVVVEAQSGGSIVRPDVIAAIDGMTAHLQSLDSVGKAISVSDPLRQLHGVFVGDASQPLPDQGDVIAQYLILIESKDYSQSLIAPDYSAANVMLRVDDNGSNALLEVAMAARDWWASNAPPGYEARVTGVMYEFARAEDEIALGQLRGLAFAVLAVGVILLAIVRSWRLAMLSLIPNAVPVAMAFGLMGLLGVPVDAGTAVLGSMALGIAVDDTIHVVEGYFRDHRRGFDAAEALESAFRRTLPALCLTTVVVSLGFGILGVSEFLVTRQLGLLTAGVMVLCLAADVLLLPALLLGGDEEWTPSVVEDDPSR